MFLQPSVKKSSKLCVLYMNESERQFNKYIKTNAKCVFPHFDLAN